MKNFDYVLGQKYNELTILSYTRPLKEKSTFENALVYVHVGKK